MVDGLGTNNCTSVLKISAVLLFLG
uniref:Uncharacterized protein n=1 Tax=Arundo donax TaxID=35708 RepID=A0A0A9AMP9_ARUDO